MSLHIYFYKPDRQTEITLPWSGWRFLGNGGYPVDGSGAFDKTRRSYLECCNPDVRLGQSSLENGTRAELYADQIGDETLVKVWSPGGSAEWFKLARCVCAEEGAR